MRENMGLFRGRTFESDEWETEWYYGYLYVEKFKGVDGYEIYLPDRPFGATEPEWHFVDPETVGECTGLRDKNGELIYEGDILKKKHGHIDVIGAVEFRGGVFGLRLNVYDGILDFVPISAYEGTKRGIVEGFEIVGNIHDNPELMGGVKE